MQKWYLSRSQQNTSAKCSAKAAVDECGKVAFPAVVDGDSRPTSGRTWTGAARQARVNGGSNADAPAANDTTRPPWVVSWVGYSSSLQLPLYASYRIPLKYSSYGPGTAVNSQLSSLHYSYPSSMIIPARLPRASALTSHSKHTCRNLTIQLLSLRRNKSGSCSP
jgi:hypothetical protein